MKDILSYCLAMQQKENEYRQSVNLESIEENSLFSNSSNHDQNNEHSKNFKNIIANGDDNTQSIRISSANKNSKICQNISILQINHAKIAQIVKEIINTLAEENNIVSTVEFSKLIKEQSKDTKLDMRNMLGFINQNLYNEYLNISNIMRIKRLDFRDTYGIKSSDLILTRENLIERTMFLIASYFCIATELRFCKHFQIEGIDDLNDAEFWHSKALELGIKFLPGDAPLVRHILSSYIKHHSPSNEKIPEDKEVESNCRIVRASFGIFYDKFSPVIKDINQPKVKFDPLEIQPNCYTNKINCRDNIVSSLDQNDCAYYFNSGLNDRYTKCFSKRDQMESSIEIKPVKNANKIGVKQLENNSNKSKHEISKVIESIESSKIIHQKAKPRSVTPNCIIRKAKITGGSKINADDKLIIKSSEELKHTSQFKQDRPVELIK